MCMTVVRPIRCHQCMFDSTINDDEYSETETYLGSKYFRVWSPPYKHEIHLSSVRVDMQDSCTMLV